MCKTCIPDARHSSSLDPPNSETWNLHHLREGFRGHRECGPVDNAVLPLTAATSIATTVARSTDGRSQRQSTRVATWPDCDFGEAALQEVVNEMSIPMIRFRRSSPGTGSQSKCWPAIGVR